MNSLLQTIGNRVRARRKSLGWSQAVLAAHAEVSARFLAQLEAGSGNISIQRLSDVCSALRIPLSTLLVGLGYQPATFVALVGLRGAGKSTVGQRLSADLDWPFVEIDTLIVERAGVSLAEIFELGGAEYYRSLELTILQQLSASENPAVLATGGSIVSSSENWLYLKHMSKTVWLKAKPESHFMRVQTQGDLRPMQGRSDAFMELKNLLSARTPAYMQSDLSVDTDLHDVEQVVKIITNHFSNVFSQDL